MLSNIKLQEGGISSRCRRRPSVLTTSFSRIGSNVTHYAGCAILFIKDTLYTNVDVKSIYFRETRQDLLVQVMEGE